MKYITEFFTANPDLMIAAFVILFGMLIGMVIGIHILVAQYNEARRVADRWMTKFGDEIMFSTDLTCRLADAEQIINALNGRVVKIRDEETQRFVSYAAIKKNILQYENRYYKKNKQNKPI